MQKIYLIPLITILLIPSIFAATEFRPGDTFRFQVCINDENGTATTEAKHVYAQIYYPNRTRRTTFQMTEVSDSIAPCMWNGTFTIPSNITRFNGTLGTWIARVNASVPDDERPATAVFFDVFPERDSLWQVAVVLMIGGSAFLFSYLFAHTEKEHQFLKLFMFCMALFALIINGAVASNIINTAGLTPSQLDPIANGVTTGYTLIVRTTWISLTFIAVYFIVNVLRLLLAVAKEKRGGFR